MTFGDSRWVQTAVMANIHFVSAQPTHQCLREPLAHRGQVLGVEGALAVDGEDEDILAFQRRGIEDVHVPELHNFSRLVLGKKILRGGLLRQRRELQAIAAFKRPVGSDPAHAAAEEDDERTHFCPRSRSDF